MYLFLADPATDNEYFLLLHSVATLANLLALVDQIKWREDGDRTKAHLPDIPLWFGWGQRRIKSDNIRAVKSILFLVISLNEANRTPSSLSSELLSPGSPWPKKFCWELLHGPKAHPSLKPKRPSVAFKLNKSSWNLPASSLQSIRKSYYLLLAYKWHIIDGKSSIYSVSNPI
jgi:hypothetical protein